MKKLLMLLASIGLTATTTASVIACGNNNRSEITKTDLKDLNLETLLPTSVIDSQTAFDLFINLNPEVSDLRDNVQMIDFTAPNYTVSGSLIVIASPNGKYTGSVKVIIPKITQFNLNGSGLNLTRIQGTEDMNAEQYYAVFLKNNQSKDLSDLRENVTLKLTKPDYDNDGSLVITGKTNTKYSGVITIEINKMRKTALIDLKNSSKPLMTTIDGTEAMIGDNSGQIALETFFDINKENYPDLVNNIEITSYDNKVGYNQNGFLHIQGINKYSGGTSIFIRYIPVTDEKIVDTIINSVSIKFGATKALNQTLADFINGVLLGGEHDDAHWYIKGQIEPYKGSFPILDYIDYNKYEFTGFYLLDEKTVLTDQYLSQNSRVGEVMKLRARFNYGTVQGRFIDFSLSFN